MQVYTGISCLISDFWVFKHNYTWNMWSAALSLEPQNDLFG